MAGTELVRPKQSQTLTKHLKTGLVKIKSTSGHGIQLTRISGQFEQVPRQIAADSLRTANKVGSRRRFLQVLGVLAFGMVLSPYLVRQRFVQASLADLQTQTGEIRSITLEDSTQLVMNTATAVDLGFSR